MTLTRAYLLAIGAFSVVIGVVYLIQPAEMAGFTDLDVTSTLGAIEVQGFYGGQLLGLGAAILLGLANPRLVVAALLLATAPLAGTAAGRLVGMLAGGAWPPLMVGLMVVEVATAALGVVLLRRELAVGR